MRSHHAPYESVQLICRQQFAVAHLVSGCGAQRWAGTAQSGKQT